MGIVDILASIAKVLPEVKAPERPPQAKERLMWTGIALVLFFFMYHITVFGVQISFAGIDFLQTITASIISVGGLSYEVMMAIVVIQIALGSVAMLYLDEIVSKYGIGSGISLFIAAGVSQAIIGG